MVVGGKGTNSSSSSTSAGAGINLNEYIDNGDDGPAIEYDEVLSAQEVDALQEEFSRLKEGCCYLDHSGATLYAKSQIDSFHSELQSSLFSNPHSRNPSSTITTDAIDHIRLRILHHFGTNPDDYSVIFTSGATSAMKLVAESFRFNGGLFAYLEESHTSVVGMRELVNLSGIPSQPQPPTRSNFNKSGSEGSAASMKDEPPQKFDSTRHGQKILAPRESQSPDSVPETTTSKVYCLAKTTLERLMESQDDKASDVDVDLNRRSSQHRSSSGNETLMESAPNREEEHNALVVYPAQCNFSGYKFPLEWVSKIQNGQLSCIANSEQFYVDENFQFQAQEQQQHSAVENNQNATTMAKNANATANREKCQDAYAYAGETKEENANTEEMRKRGRREYSWHVLVDAASYVGSNGLDLSLYPADFVAVSFYKMFGFPTGLGALIVRNKSAHVLEKRYFGGGTVNIAMPSSMFHVKRAKLHERFEDGTISFLSILAVRHGLDTMLKLGRSLDTISTRTFRLAKYLYEWLSSMKYPNGQPVARIYADTKYETRLRQGPVVTFNLLRPDGSIIGYSELEQVAYLHDVHLRYGCFCNPGACRRHLRLSHDEVLKHFEAGHVCGDMRDLIDGKPTGAVRASFGYMTRRADVDTLLRLVYDCWVRPFQIHMSNCQRQRNEDREGEGCRPDTEADHLDRGHGHHLSSPAHNNNSMKGEEHESMAMAKSSFHQNQPARDQPSHTLSLGNHRGRHFTPPTRSDHEPEADADAQEEDIRKLLRIFLYPIKSCAPFEVSERWPIGARGLLYDREWLIMNSSGVPLTQKREPRLCQLKPGIDVNNGRLVLRMKGNLEMTVPLETAQLEKERRMEKIEICNTKVCGDIVSGLNCGEEVSNWLSAAFDRPGLKLIRIAPEFQRNPRTSSDEISLANQSQFLLLTTGSLRFMAEQLHNKGVYFSTSEDDESDDENESVYAAAVSSDKSERRGRQERNLRMLIRHDGTHLSSRPRPSQDEITFRKLMTSELKPISTNKNEERTHSSDSERLDESEMQLAQTMENLIHRFRTNFVISCSLPFQEESWGQVNIGGLPFKSGGPCMRCATICMNPVTGERSSEPLLTLSAVREGRPTFGIHLYSLSNSANDVNDGRGQSSNASANMCSQHSSHNTNTDNKINGFSSLTVTSKAKVQVADEDALNGDGNAKVSENSPSSPLSSDPQHRIVQVNNAVRVVKWLTQNGNGDADGEHNKSGESNGNGSGSGSLTRVDMSKSQRNTKIQQQQHLHKLDSNSASDSASELKFSSLEPSDSSTSPRIAIADRSSVASSTSASTSWSMTRRTSRTMSKRDLIETID